MDIRYPANLETHTNDTIWIRFIDLPDAFAEGRTREEAISNAAEVLSTILAKLLAESKDAPAPSQGMKDVCYIAPDSKTQAAVLLHLARGERSLSDLARALEKTWPAAQRLEDPTHWPSLKTIDRAAAALGKRLVLALE
ncbi:MAG: type II toxin-antitoxin system HicB family antitoxin [Methylococcales bacterium]